MTDHADAVDVLIKYYAALGSGTVRGIGRYFDTTVTLISATGSSVLSGATEIESAFQTLLDTWKGLGVSWKFQFEQNRFRVETVQDNVIQIRTRLTNFRESGEVFESWNCMYVLVDTANGWKIALATFDDKGTDEFAKSA